MENLKEKTGLVAWLTTDSISSPLQAWSHKVYFGGKRFATQPLAMFGFIVIALLLLVAMAAPLLAPYDPLQQDLAKRLLPPDSDHLFGTDELGRDLLSRIIYGSRVSLYIIMLVTTIQDRHIPDADNRCLPGLPRAGSRTGFCSDHGRQPG